MSKALPHWKPLYRVLIGLGLVLLTTEDSIGQVERIWLTHPTSTPDTLAINWETATPGNSVVRYGTSETYEEEVAIPGNTTLHHVEIPLRAEVATYHYQVATGTQQSPGYTFRNYPTEELRVAVVADWQSKPALDALYRDSVHLLLTAGDNIPNLHTACGVGVRDCIEPYRQLIDAYPELFRSTPFMPILGNHDREIRPRGKNPPADAVYDVDASAFRRFFALPDEEWKWSLVLPSFNIRFVALDLNHIADQGNTWQTCHPFGKDSPQFEWYRALMASADQAYVVTLQNEKNERMRQQENGAWHRLFRQGTAVITGYGYFAERAEKDGVAYFNTSLSGTGDAYPDTYANFFRSQDSYVLITVFRQENTMSIALKGLDGTVLDRTEWSGR